MDLAVLEELSLCVCVCEKRLDNYVKRCREARLTPQLPATWYHMRYHGSHFLRSQQW